MTRRVFVSDVHMSTADHPYDWLQPDQAQRFLDFLDDLANGPDRVDELVLVGDMFDDWVCPVDVLPKRFSDIAAKQTGIVGRLKTISETKPVTYVLGNHDMSITKDSILDFGNGRHANIFFKEYYEQDGILAQHGHQFGMYNAYDPINSLPLGHYISRLYATAKIQERWQTKLGEALKNTLGGVPDPFVNAPLSYLAEQVDIDDDHRIVKVDGGIITLGEVRRLYADLPVRWIKSNGLLGPIESALEETPAGLTSEAENTAKKFQEKVVVFGHTHVAEISYVQIYNNVPGGPSSWQNIAVYANCGSWCQANAQYTYVVDEYDEGTKQHTVSLKAWKNPDFQEPAPLTI